MTTLALLLMAAVASSAQESAKTTTSKSGFYNGAPKTYKPGKRKPEEMPPDILANELKHTLPIRSDLKNSATVKTWCAEHKNLLESSILQNLEFGQLSTKNAKCIVEYDLSSRGIGANYLFTVPSKELSFNSLVLQSIEQIRSPTLKYELTPKNQEFVARMQTTVLLVDGKISVSCVTVRVQLQQTNTRTIK
ncbi:MAG: hypothetical protein SFY67_17525 [Candidatus Melainabacteria bacterium]|nr:hypothetical protein [Candidatus Melainabacteria bacterium]